MVFRREGAYAVTSVRNGVGGVALVLLAFLLFATPAWGQVTIEKDDEPDPVEVGDLLLYTVTVTNDSTTPQTVVVRDDLPNNVRFEAVGVDGGVADECEETNNEDREVVCEITLAPDEATETTDDDEATIQILVEPEAVGEITNIAEVFQATAGPPLFDITGSRIGRATEDTTVVNNRRDRDRDRDRFRDRFPRDFFDDPNDFVDEDNDNIPDIFDEDIEGDEDGDGDVDQDDELADAENDLNGEETTDGDAFNDELGDDDGVSATADENGAEASTPGAVASAGGDPDELAPETSVPDDVVDDVVTSGPLPNTGGVPVAAGAVLAMVLFGAGLLAVRLVMVWRERRA